MERVIFSQSNVLTAFLQLIHRWELSNRFSVWIAYFSFSPDAFQLSAVYFPPQFSQEYNYCIVPQVDRFWATNYALQLAKGAAQNKGLLFLVTKVDMRKILFANNRFYSGSEKSLNFKIKRKLTEQRSSLKKVER